MNELEVEGFLSHFGVPGMKWGVRKDGKAGSSRGPIRRGATKANSALNAGSKAINEGEKKLIFLPDKFRQQAASATQRRVLGEAIDVNRQSQFKGQDLKKRPQLKASYEKKIEARAKDIYQEELAKVRTQAVTETIDALFTPRGDRLNVTASSTRVKHAQDQNILASFAVERNELDHVIGLEVVSTGGVIKQSDAVAEFLSHYGVPGMKWGVRKQRTPEEAAARSARNKKIAKGAAVVGVAAVAAAGAVYANKQIKQANLNIKLRELNSAQAQRKEMGKIYSNVFFNGGGGGGRPIPPGAIPMGPGARPMSGPKTPVSALKASSPQAKKFVEGLKTGEGKKALAAIDADRARRNKEVTEQLKSWYNESSTPVKDRWYPGG